MRHRLDNGLTALPHNIVYLVDDPCGSTTVIRDSEVAKVGRYRTMDDVVTPRWFRRDRNSYFFNPLSMYDELNVHSGTGGEFKENGALVCPSGQWPRFVWDAQSVLYDLGRTTRFGLNPHGTLRLGSLTAVASDEISSAVRELSTRVQSKIKTGDSQGLESLAEIKKTIDLIRHPLEGATKLTSAFYKVMKSKGGVLRKGYEISNELRKSVQSEWLKYRYGVLPLINDIKAVIKALDSAHGKVLKSERAKLSLKGNTLNTVTYGTGGWIWDITQSVNTEVLVRAVTVDSYETSISTDLGLSPEFIPVTLWELVPYSFVVDWFVNVGDFLYAITPRVGVDHKGGCTTVEVRNVIQLTTAGVTNINPADIITTPTMNFTQSSRTKTRVVGLQKPTLVVKRDFRFSNNVRLADAAALIGIQLNKISDRFGSIL